MIEVPGMRIGEVAAEAAVNVQTLRYYERVGLLPTPERRASGYRTYDPQTVRRVRFIKRAQELGFRSQRPRTRELLPALRRCWCPPTRADV